MKDWLTYLENVPGEYLWISSCIALFMILAIVSLCITLFYRGYKLRRARNKKVLVETVDGFVQEIIFEQQQESALRWIKGKSFSDRQFFLNRLLLIGRQFSGEYSLQISDFYNKSPLKSLSLKNLRESNRRDVVRAIHEITELGLESAEEVIEKRLRKEKKAEIQLELSMGLLQINPSRAFEWLLKDDIYLNEWQQLSILVRVERASGIKVPPLEAWTKKNDSLLILGCRLAGSRNSFEDHGTLLNLLKRDSVKVQAEVIGALLKLEYPGLGNLLQEIYAESARAIKLEILQTFQKLRDRENIPFLMDCLSDGEFEICFEALKGVYLSGKGSFEGISFPDFTQTDLNALRQHLEDPRI